MIKLLYIHDYPHTEGGGVEIQTYQDALALSLRGYDVKIATTRVQSETFSDAAKSSYPQYVNDHFSLEVLDSLDAMNRLLSWADVVHIQATFSLRPATMTALRLLATGNRNFFVSLRTTIGHLPFSNLSVQSPLVKDDLLKTFARCLESPYCHIIGVSNVIQDSLDWLGVSKKMTVVYNAKDWSRFTSDNISHSVSPVDLTYVGEISWMKGFHVLLGSFSLLLRDFPNLKIRIIGGGQNFHDVVAITQSLCLRKNIEFVGYTKNEMIPAYLFSTKILAIPSLTESWCNVAMEALGLGVLVVASKTEGLIELLENGKLGLLFEQGDPFDLYKKIKTALTDRDTFSLYTDSSIAKHIKSTYSLDLRINHLDRLYQSVLV